MGALPNIGLIGRARTGKDTAAAMLGHLYGYQRTAFADPLRATMADLNPIVHPGGIMLGTKWYGGPVRWRVAVGAIGYEAAKDLLPEVRRLLQVHGTAIREHAGAETWVNAWERRRPPGPLVVTDVRFTNEADRLRALGYTLVRLTREDAPNAGTHVSEVELDNYLADYTIPNDGALDDLEAALDDIVTARTEETADHE